jgi:hypothetical protein
LGDGRLGRELEFQKFVEDLLHAEHARIVDTEAPGGRLRADLLAHIDGMLTVIELQAETPQTNARFSATVAQLTHLARAISGTSDEEVRPVLAVPGVLAQTKSRRARLDGIQIWDGADLRERAILAGVHAPAFVATSDRLGLDQDEVRLGDRADLGTRLAELQPGRANWRRYESFCEDLLTYLFCPPLELPIAQDPDEQDANRRDFILPNYTSQGFWHFVRQHYRADYVVAEAKNRADKLDKNQVLQLANYLTRHGTGLFGVFLCRTGLNPTAEWIRREQWILHDKMIICLNDDDCRQMITNKRTGGEPADVVRQHIEDFRLKV